MMGLPACGETPEPKADESGDADSATGADEETTGEDTAAQPGEGVWEIRMPEFSPNAAYSSYYACYSQTFTVDQAVHLTGFRPKVTDPHVHHYVVQVLDEPTTDDPYTPCFEEPWDDMIWGWAPGGEELHLPDHVGFKAGETGTVTIRFQVHYDNPLNDKFVDQGGFDVLWTDELREFDAGIGTFGDVFGINIPANAEAYEHVADCSTNFSEVFFPEDMHILGTWLHAHEIGSVLWGEVIPGDGSPPYELGREDPYRFDYQTFRTVEGVTLHPGDQVNTHCVYDNSGNDKPVEGGPTTKEEMCVNFLLYYPKRDGLDECGNL